MITVILMLKHCNNTHFIPILLLIGLVFVDIILIVSFPYPAAITVFTLALAALWIFIVSVL